MFSPLSFFQMRKMTGDFSENYWSLTSLQLSAFPLQHIKPLLLAKRLPGSSAYSAQWPLHCGGVRCSAASCFFSFCFTVHKVSNHGVAWQKVLMVFWSTSFKSHLLFSYECVVFISTSLFVCHNYSPSVALPLKRETCVFKHFYWTHFIIAY